MKRSTVSILKTSVSRVLEDYEKILKLANAEVSLARGKTTILKDNISWHFYYPSANSTPWQMEGTIRGLRKLGYRDLVAVHNDTVVTDPFKGQEFNKLNIVYEKFSVPVRYNCVKGDISWVRYLPQAKLRVLPKIYPKGIYLPEFFFGKNIVHLPTMKTHIYTTTTGAMKNAFGGLLNTRRHYTHSWIHETLVDLLAIQKEIHSGLFAVMDATVAGNGAGPRTMKPVETNLILASGDQVAIDAVAAKVMGFDPLKIKYIRMAHESGLGVGDVREIDIVGADIERFQYRFRVGNNLVRRAAHLFWFSPFKKFQRLFFRTPLVYLFVFGSSMYHDYFWYPLIGKMHIDNFEKKSPWGELFLKWK